MAAPEEEILDIFQATDLDVLEGLVFSEDRLAFLDENFSNKEEAYWFYRILTLQKRFGISTSSGAKALAGCLDAVKKVKNVVDSENIKNVLRRQALINFSKSSAAIKKQTLKELRSMIGSKTEAAAAAEEAKKAKGPKSKLELDSAKLLDKTWAKFNLDKREDLQNVFTPHSVPFLSKQKLTPTQTTEFLDLVDNESPEVPYLLTYVTKDIKENGTAFGDKTIHYRLTKEHLDLLGKTQQCRESETYMRCYAWKLRKVTDVSYKYDIKARTVYLDELKKFADSTLSKNPNFNSLRALILYNWLLWQEETKGAYDKRSVKSYLKIPKNSEYCAETYAEAKNMADLNYEVDLIKELYPIVDDVAFVRRALRHIFQNSDDNTSKWKDVFDASYLRKLYTEVKLMNGQGKTAELRRAYGQFGKYAYQELTQSVNIELLRNNKVYHSVEDPVSLTLLLKNVPELEIRIFQIDCKEYFLRFKDRVNLDIPLDGLEPNFTIEKNWEENSLIQRTRKVDLPQLRGKRGVFLIEFFGNGRKTRALIRKGELRYIKHQEFATTETSAGSEGLGYLFRVFNELNQPVQHPELYMDGKRYTAESDDGLVFVPFAEMDQPNCPMIIEDLDNPGSATIHFFHYRTENYKLECGMFVDRESLLEKQQAKLIIRPSLLLNDMPASVSNLKNIQLSIITTDAQGYSHKKVEPLQFVDNEETVEIWTVPTELRKVEFELKCQVYCLSQDLTITLCNDEQFTINDIDGANALADLHLMPMGEKGYVLAALGKNGEPYKGVEVDVELTHRLFTNKLKYTLKTDKNGQITLGKLADVSLLEAVASSELVFQEADEDWKHTWHLLQNQVNVPSIVNVMKGQTVRIPFMSDEEKGPKIDVYDYDFVKQYKNVSFRNGYVEIKGLPSGVFQVFIRDVQTAQVMVYVSKGDIFDKHAVSPNRIVELSDERPLTITEVDGSRAGGFKVQLAGFNEATRVHAFVSSLVPRFSCYSFLHSPEIAPSVIDYQAYPGLYGDVESVSDEYKYISARKSSAKYSGNMLQRPTLLTKRFTTSPKVKQRRPPQSEYDETDELFKNQTDAPKKSARFDLVIPKVMSDCSNLEFLTQPSSVLCNYPVDKDGCVVIPSETISDCHNLLQIIAVDGDNTTLQNVILPIAESSYKDVRLMTVLDPSVHWTEKREIIELTNPGETLRIANFATSSIEVYDDIADVYELYQILGTDERLINFKFLTVWNEYDLEKKLSVYDDNMCAEVNYFLYRKDKEFFDNVIAPLLNSKVQKSFMDLYLLGKDLAAYCGVIKYQSLNTLERILLASRVEALVAPTIKYLTDAVSSDIEVPQESASLFAACHEAKQNSADDSEDQYGRHKSMFNFQEEKTGKIIDQSREFQETRYYRVAFEDQTADLITPSRFWLDFAKFMLGQSENQYFLSRYFWTPTKNLSQMLMGLACLDLPYRSEVTDFTLEYLPNSPSVDMTVHQSSLVLSRQVKESQVQTSALSVSTNYFDPVDRFEVVDFEKQDKFLKMPLITHKVYGCRVVVTNVSSICHTIELLNQIPQGAIPVKNGFRTKNLVETLDPYTTVFHEFYFYFPEPGTFTHFNTRVSKNGRVIGFGLEDPNITVVSPEVIVDTTSWDYMSTRATKEELLAFLTESTDVYKVDLSMMAERMNEEEMFIKTTAILRDRQTFDETIWSYSLKHMSIVEVKEYLNMQPKFLESIAPELDNSVLADYDAFERQTYQMMEYWPLTSARSHYHGLKNDEFLAQYFQYLRLSFYRSFSVDSIPAADQMTGVYYFLLQNRVTDALQLFAKVNADDAKTVSEFTYDYLRTFLSFYSQDVSEIAAAQAMCDEYLSKPLPPSKKNLWQEVADLLAELKDISFGDADFDTTTEADLRNARSRKLTCDINSDRTLTLSYKNVDSCEINFYQTDIELQFSTAPFRQQANAYNFVAPTETMQVVLDPSQRAVTLELPSSLHDKSSVVEVIGGGFTLSQPNYDNELRIEISESLSQIRVFNKNSNKAIAKAYVKVYAQTPDAPEGRFLKDGYTDLRGRFDYTKVSTDEDAFISALAILVLTDSAGADVLEVAM